MGVRVVDNGAEAMIARVKAASASRATVRVGVLSNAPKKTRQKATGKYSLLEVAAVHEFGAPAAGIPQRSFIRATVDARRADIDRLQRTLLEQVVAGKIELRASLDALGAKVAGWCQQRIADGIAPPNAESTVRKKKSSKPLIDTGQLRSSITWTVEGT